MAICPECQLEMKNKVSCTATTVRFPDGKRLDVVRYDGSKKSFCHDCLTPGGGIHHPGCDFERCPRCGGQLISCGCLDSTEEEDNHGDHAS